MKNKTLYIGGTFNDNNGKFSKLAHTIFNEIKQPKIDYINGGNFNNLENIIETIDQYKLIYWFTDIPNNKPKLIKEIKKKNKACILVTSKRNHDNKYTFIDLVHHALGNKSNLFVELSEKQQRYQGRVIDPLGNIFLNYEQDFSTIGKIINKRSNELLNYTREQSKSVGRKLEIPNEKEFFKVIKQYGSKFHELIHSHDESVDRFFGNASFRCERGFPSFKKDNLIYVSQRNIDKRYIGQEGFVAVNQTTPVEYYGNIKPSVDTPIQVRLFQHFKNLRYMLHGHVYIQDAPFTDNVIPCGAIEEAKEIIKKFPDENSINFSINLRGHGSLVLVDNLKHFENIPYIRREPQELQHNYVKGCLNE